MFNDSVAHAVITAAKDNHIDPAALLAVVEVETGGKTFENDGRTPQFLYERHIAYREARKVGQKTLSAFIKAGLAIPKWNRATQYKDERTSAQRLALMQRACDIDEEVAKSSASWGLGQTMGFLAEEIGFDKASELVAHQTGSISGQLDCMVRELKNKDLIKSLNAHDWVRTARLYNGARYAENQYDTRLRDAYARWSRKLPQLFQGETPREVPPEQKLARDEIEAIQEKLRDLGFHEIGTIDGRWGTKTTGAISAFQAHQGLPVTTHYDAATKAALESAEVPRDVDDERATASADDLRDMGSKTISNADTLSKLSTAGKTIGGTLTGGAIAEQGGLLDNAGDAIDKAQTVTEKVSHAKDIWGEMHDFVAPVLNHPGAIIIGIAVFVGFWAVGCIAKRIIAARVADHQSGVHSGPEA